MRYLQYTGKACPFRSHYSDNLSLQKYVRHSTKLQDELPDPDHLSYQSMHLSAEADSGNLGAVNALCQFFHTNHTLGIPVFRILLRPAGCGKNNGYSFDTILQIFPDSSIRRSFTAEVPRSTPIKYIFILLKFIP